MGFEPVTSALPSQSGEDPLFPFSHFKGDRQQIVVAHNTYKLFLFISLICLGRYGHLQPSPRILYPPLFQVNEYEYNLCVI